MVKVKSGDSCDDQRCGCGRDTGTGTRDVMQTVESGSNCTHSGSVEVW